MEEEDCADGALMVIPQSLKHPAKPFLARIAYAQPSAGLHMTMPQSLMVSSTPNHLPIRVAIISFSQFLSDLVDTCTVTQRVKMRSFQPYAGSRGPETFTNTTRARSATFALLDLQQYPSALSSTPRSDRGDSPSTNSPP